MNVKQIDIDTKVTDKDLKEYRKRNIREENDDKIVGWTALDVDMNLPIVSIDFGGEYERVDLVNPVITDASEQQLVYFEFDANKPDKLRKTVRHSWVKVDTSNLGEVIFESNKSEWKDRDDLMGDEGLFEAVTAQRLIDALSGIEPSDPRRRYNKQVVKQRDIGRNERVMLQSPEGETTFIKWKHAQPLLEDGYQLL